MRARRAFYGAVRRANNSGEIQAVIGKGDTAQTVFVDGKPQYVWVRIQKSGGETGDPQHALCNRVLPTHGANVICKMNSRDILEVMNPDPTAAPLYSDQSTAVGKHAVHHGFHGVDAIQVAGLQFLPLLVHPKPSPDMNVVVESGVYFDTNGTQQLYDGASLDLTSYVPGTVNQQRIVIVGLDTGDETLSVTAGTAQAFLVSNFRSNPFQTTDIETVLTSVPGDVLPLAAVRLHYSQTLVTTYHMMRDLRNYAGNSTSAGTAIFNRILIDGYDVLTDGFNVLSDA